VLFRRLEVADAYAVEVERVEDERGWFGRLFSVEEFSRFGLDARVSQCSLSFNIHAGTLRGMHLQVAPDEEAKLVMCISGSVYDVLVDLRPGSSTYRSWAAVSLACDRPCAVFVPPGVAHGFLTMVDNSTVYYQISAPYHKESAAGVRWDDPAFGIKWPRQPAVISERDTTFEAYTQ
jgi:dTDP-4-dehydrorhamnose 3,5-epimerase